MPFFATATATLALACSPYQLPRIITDAMGGQVCHQAPPPGTGLVDGRGMIQFPRSGFYTFIGGEVNSQKTRYYPEGDWGGVRATSSRFEWIRPDGVREVVPKQFLYRPFGTIVDGGVQ